MILNFDEIKSQIQTEAGAINDAASLEAFRIKYAGRKGILQDIYASLATASASEKPIVGKNANEIKNLIDAVIKEKNENYSENREFIKGKALG